MTRAGRVGRRPHRQAPRSLLLAASLVALLVGVASGCSDDRPPPAGSRTLRAGSLELHAVEREPDGTPTGTVLFLHGASYTSRIWHDRGILDRVASLGHRAVAVDLPGYGESPDTDEPPADVLADVVRSLGPPGTVVVVSPSMSGRWSLALLQERPEVALAGFVAVAPVGIEQFDRPAGAQTVPALLVWGEDDDVAPRSQADVLADQLEWATIEVVPDGSHAPYDDEPEAFLELLERYLASTLGREPEPEPGGS